MDEVLHANIFFFITGVAVIIFTALLCVALFHVIKVLKSLRRIMDRIEAGTEIIAEDMQHVREFFAQEGLFGKLLNSLTSPAKKMSARGTRGKGEKRNAEL